MTDKSSIENKLDRIKEIADSCAYDAKKLQAEIRLERALMPDDVRFDHIKKLAVLLSDMPSDIDFNPGRFRFSVKDSIDMFNKLKREAEEEQEKKSKEEEEEEIEADAELRIDIQSVIDSTLRYFCHKFIKKGECPELCVDGHCRLHEMEIEKSRIEAVNDIFNLLKKDQESE
jgi:hypothetical protein